MSALNTIPDNTLQTLDFHLSSLDYLEEEALQFINVTNVPDLTIETVDNG